MPGIMWWPGKIPAGAHYGEMMSHIDCWSTLAAMAGITPPPHGEWKDNNGKPIYFDSIDNSAYILGKAEHSARKSWVFINGEYLNAIRVDMGGDPKEPWINIAWKFIWTAKDSWLGPVRTWAPSPRPITSAWTPTRNTTWSSMKPRTRAMRLHREVCRSRQRLGGGAVFRSARRLRQVDHEVSEHQAFPGRASNDLIPDLQHPENPVPALDPAKMPKAIPGGG